MTLEKIYIHGIRHTIPAKVRGSLSNKWNRAAKLMSRFEELDAKFRGMVERGGFSDHGRLALASLLMMHTGIRVGNESSAEGYTTKPHPKSDKEPVFVQTYGLTTLLSDHVLTSKAGTIYLNFVGKKQVDNSFMITDKFLVLRVKMLLERKSPTLFDITDYQLTRFIKKYVGVGFSPKDFRTMRAHIEASGFIARNFQARYTRKKDLKADLKSLFVYVSGKLNNLPGTCKKSYITDMWPVYLENNRYRPEKASK